MFNAHVTVSPIATLITGSLVTVEDTDRSVLVAAEVPELCPRHGFIMFWHRVNETLADHGWLTVDAVSDHLVDGGVVRFNVKRIGEG